MVEASCSCCDTALLTTAEVTSPCCKIKEGVRLGVVGSDVSKSVLLLVDLTSDILDSLLSELVRTFTLEVGLLHLLLLLRIECVLDTLSSDTDQCSLVSLIDIKEVEEGPEVVRNFGEWI